MTCLRTVKDVGAFLELRRSSGWRTAASAALEGPEREDAAARGKTAPTAVGRPGRPGLGAPLGPGAEAQRPLVVLPSLDWAAELPPESPGCGATFPGWRAGSGHSSPKYSLGEVPKTQDPGPVRGAPPGLSSPPIWRDTRRGFSLGSVPPTLGP